MAINANIILKDSIQPEAQVVEPTARIPGINANIFVKSQELVQSPKPTTSMSALRASTNNLTDLQSSKSIDNIKEPSVVVDGKVKKISKKSAFLLDMLSLDD